MQDFKGMEHLVDNPDEEYVCPVVLSSSASSDVCDPSEGAASINGVSTNDSKTSVTIKLPPDKLIHPESGDYFTSPDSSLT